MSKQSYSGNATPHDAKASAAAAVGTKLGRYYLASQIASGGMATVFLATVKGPGGFEKVNALKRIHPHLAEETDFVDMFLDEARIASRIHHANVCQVFDFGESEGTYFIAMEYLIGEPLSRAMKTIRKNFETLDSARLPVIACKIIADAAEGLHAAHDLKGRDGNLLNVVHRDVSPQNLFVTYDGNVKVVDFGIASASDRVHHTSAGQVKGKFSYMAPEQSRGGSIDRRADVWALGVVMWEMLTLRRLFRRETTVETLTAMLNDPIPPPSTYRPGVDPQLDQIVLKALARDPDNRYATARDFARDLTRYAGATGEPAHAAELADWMDAIFPDGRQQKYDIMDAAQRGELDATVVTHMEVSESEVQPVDPDRLPPPAADPHYPSETPAPMDAQSPTMPGGTPVVGPGGSHYPQQQATGPYAAQTGPYPAQGGRPMLYAALGALSVLILVGIAGAVAWAALTGDTPPPAVGTASAIEPVQPQGDPIPEPPSMEPQAEADAAVGEGSDEEEADAGTEIATAPTMRPNMIRRGGRNMRRTGGRMDPDMEPDMEPAEQQSSTGEAVIMTPGGWANVYDAGGRHLGQTPLRVTLPVGTHQLRLRPFGQPPDQRIRVTITGDGNLARVVTRVEE
jgi:serine/threonine-protein kinase